MVRRARSTADLPLLFHEFLKQIYDEAQHMVSLIENIIKISRLDEEADALPVDKVDLYEIAQTVIEQLDAGAQGVTIPVHMM